MLYRLDLHCHSIASDGSFPIWELAQFAKDAGLDGLVVTDHCRPNNAYQTNLVVLESMKFVNAILPVPVILGSEIRTPYGEFLLFGKKACKQWDYYKEQLEPIAWKFGVDQYWEMFKKYVLHKVVCEREGHILKATPTQPLSYALVICHPASLEKDINWCKRMPTSFWNMVHGFEIQNGVEQFDFLNSFVIDYFKEHIHQCKCLRNSDCHSNNVGEVYNEIELKEVSENQLIHWFRI